MSGIPQRLYVGNIAWEVSPDVVLKLLQEAGPVVDFALRPDPAGQKPHRGFGHVIYHDEATAHRAVSIVSGRQIMGRALKVAHPEAIPGPVHAGMLGPGVRAGMYAGTMNLPSAPSVPALPSSGLGGGAHGSSGGYTGVPSTTPATLHGSNPAGAPASIRSALEAMSPGELWAILSELKSMAVAQPEAARALLLQYPMLAHAIVHIQAMLGTLATPTPAYGAGVVRTGGVGAEPSQAAPVDEEQKALVRSVLGMSDEDVAAMPTEQREGVEQIRLALRSPLEALQAMDGPARDELLQLREQLTAVLAAM